jgi:hypothetical protein
MIVHRQGLLPSGSECEMQYGHGLTGSVYDSGLGLDSPTIERLYKGMIRAKGYRHVGETSKTNGSDTNRYSSRQLCWRRWALQSTFRYRVCRENGQRSADLDADRVTKERWCFCNRPWYRYTYQRHWWSLNTVTQHATAMTKAVTTNHTLAPLSFYCRPGISCSDHR